MRATTVFSVFLALVALSLPACEHSHAEEHGETHHEHHKIVATSPVARDIVVTQPYVCQIHSRRHINVCALENGYLEEIQVKEGQTVKEGEVLFRIKPTLYQARLEAEMAEANVAEREYRNTERLYNNGQVVSQQEVALFKSKYDKALAKVKLAAAEVDFTIVKAPFDGIIDRLEQQQGSLIKEGEVLTNLSDNSVMWVYFNVPEARYFEYKRREGKSRNPSRLELADSKIELRLADGSTFHHDAGHVVTVEGMFNNETGNIPFRADFPNPDGLLRHGQTGTVLIRRTLHDAVVIPQRATFEILDKRYVFVLDESQVVHQREITVEHELDDIYIIKTGLGVKDKIVLDGVRQVHQGEKLDECEYRKPDEALANQKYHAE